MEIRRNKWKYMKKKEIYVDKRLFKILFVYVLKMQNV